MDLQIDGTFQTQLYRQGSSDVDDIIKSRKIQLFLKRLLDLMVSLIALILLCPFFIATSVIIKLDSDGPVFFIQKRVGKGGRTFDIFKFRTMVTGAEKKGLSITIGNDARITKCGAFLRKYKLDELPQLINVFLGTMSLVGPRPEVPKYVDLYTPVQMNILKMRPGITDFASIEYKDESIILQQFDDPERAYIEVIMPAKFALNMEYIGKFSLLLDLKLILTTMKKVFV